VVGAVLCCHASHSLSGGAARVSPVRTVVACSAMGAAVLNGCPNRSVCAPMSVPAVDWSWIATRMLHG
jgi:hypothetical protein